MNMDISKLTRAQGEKLAAATDAFDDETLKALADHKNKHVAHKALYKMAHRVDPVLKAEHEAQTGGLGVSS